MSSHNIPFLNIKMNIILNYAKSATMGFVPRDPRTSSIQPWKRAISVRAIEVLLYIGRSIHPKRHDRQVTALLLSLLNTYIA